MTVILFISEFIRDVLNHKIIAMLKGHVQCSEWEVNEFRKDTSPSAVSRGMCRPCRIGIQIRNMKMDFNIYGTWRWGTFEKIIMKIYEFFYNKC